METVKKFYDALANDEAMRKRGIASNEKLGENPSADALKAETLAFAKAEGYDFTAAELDAYAKQAKPLSDDELDAVAGGISVDELMDMERPELKHGSHTQDGRNEQLPVGNLFCICATRMKWASYRTVTVGISTYHDVKCYSCGKTSSIHKCLF